MSEPNKIIANCPVSHVVFTPGEELIPFNGFAWSNSQGIVVQSNTLEDRDVIRWLGTQP